METLRFLMATSFYPPYHLGGDAVHVRYLAEALAEQGHEVHVEFSPAAYRLKRGGVPDAAEADAGVHLHPIPSPFGRVQPASAYVFGRSQGVSGFHARLLRDVRPDVVHLHNVSLLGAGLLRPVPGACTVYTAHDYWMRCPRSDLLKYGIRPCDAPACVTCCLRSGRPPQLWRSFGRWRRPFDLDLAIAPSRFMARALDGRLACPVVHIPNFAPDPNPAGMLSEPGDYYLFVGALEPHKGVEALASAAARLPGFRIRFAGRGSLWRRLQEARDGGAANIDLEGWRTQAQLQPLYERARALILPSMSHDNAPLAAIEALAWGAPLLVSRRGGLEEILQGGSAGRSCEPNAGDLADAVRRFEDDGLPRRLRPSARTAFERHHRARAYLERYLAAVRDPGSVAGSALGEPLRLEDAPIPFAETARGGGLL